MYIDPSQARVGKWIYFVISLIDSLFSGVCNIVTQRKEELRERVSRADQVL